MEADPCAARAEGEEQELGKDYRNNGNTYG